MTSLLAQDRVSPEQAASILQQMLPANALNTLQARLNTPRGSMEEARCYRCGSLGVGQSRRVANFTKHSAVC